MEKFIKIHLGEPNKGKEIFVREKDFKEMQKALRSKKSDRIIKSTINLIIGSPDGMNDILKSIQSFSFIHGCESIGALETFRDLVNYKIQTLRAKNKSKKTHNMKQKNNTLTKMEETKK